MNHLATTNNKISKEVRDVIKNMYFPKASDNEFKAFLFDAEAKGLTPSKRISQLLVNMTIHVK